MKAKITTAIACLCLLVASCTDVSLLDFDMDFATAELTISATDSANGTFDLVSPPINPKEEMDKYGVSAESIKEVKIKQVTIVLKSPETGNFNWAKNAIVSISADGQPEEVIGEILDVPLDVQDISVNINNKDIAEYLKAGTFMLTLHAENDEMILVDHVVEIMTTFKVKI